MRLAFIKCHGSGNDFPLIDARAIALEDAGWAQVARALADRAGPVGGDGMLLLTGPSDGAAFGMRMFNSDGSEAESCLNGLRCVARAGFEALGLDAARVRLKQSFADVARVADLAPGVATVRTVAQASTDPVAVGIRVVAPVIDAPIDGLPSARAFTAVAMPNPHLVSFVDRVDEDGLVTLGAWCEARPALLVDRANVSFVEMRGPDLFVRTCERGVGMTNACGTAMAASVHAAVLTGRIDRDSMRTVFNAGGMVRGSADADGRVTIEGNATFEWEADVEVDLDVAVARDLRVIDQRVEEVAAWDAVVAGIARAR